MKLRFVSITVLTGILLVWTSAAFCQNAISMSEWVEKVGQGSINWSAEIGRAHV